MLHNRARSLAVPGFFFALLLVSQQTFAEVDQAYIEELVARADREKVYDDIGYKRIMFVREGLISGSYSVFDDPKFYMSGRRDLRGELSASIRGLLQPGVMTVNDDSGHPRCFFPARYRFLRERLNIDESRIATAQCPELEKFRKFADYTGVSLVFSSYFADNPGSMFGHTLLRLHRTRNNDQVGLLDDASNFAAQVAVMNPLTYPFKGLFGMFPGRFAIIPYSEKIQEYNNFESRDLWEFELDISPQEIERMILSVWEMGYFTMDYFYLDENCSYMMLALLETARPTLKLTDQFHLYAIPSDTVKALGAHPEIVRDIRYKQSARTRYLERAKNLKSDETKLFLDIISRYKNSFNREEFNSLLVKCDEPCRVRLIDTLLEFIDFQEKKVSIKEMEFYTDFRKGLLIERSKIRLPSQPLTFRPEETRPDLGPRPGIVELWTGWSDNGFNHSEFRWRPAHHDLTSSSLGYSDQLQIQILDTILAYEDELKRTYLKRFSLIELTSLGRNELALNPNSWHFELGYHSDRVGDEIFNRSELEFGYGKALFLGRFTGFAMLNLLGGYSSHPDQRWHYGLGPKLGVYYSLSDRLRWSAFFHYTRSYGRKALDRRAAESRLSYVLSKTKEGALEFRTQDALEYFGASLRFFF